MSPIPPKGTPERSEYFAALIRKRWDKPRPTPIDKRTRTLPSGSPLEERWMAKAEELGLVPDGMSRNAHRRLAKRLSDDDTARRVRRMHDARPAGIDDDDDLLLAHYQAEAARWRTRAERDRRVAAEHERIADEAETALVDLMFRLGLTS